MSQLHFSPRLNRLVRQDPPAELGQPTRPHLEAAIREGRTGAAIAWLDYFLLELAQIRTIFGVWDWYMVRYYLDRAGEGEWAELLRQSLAPWAGTTAGLQGQPVAAVQVEGRSAQLAVPGLNFTLHLVEGEQRFDLTLDAPQVQAQRWADWRTAMEAAVARGQASAAQRLLDEHVAEARLIHDIECDWAWALLTVIACQWGEAVLGEVLRVTEEPWVTVRYEKIQGMSAEESLRLTVEGMRGHLSGPDRAGTIDVAEEADRYVLSFDACGTGGRMRRGDPKAGSGSRLLPPYNFLSVAGAYDWTWNRKGVCAYCAHCAVVNQILPIEGLGRPMRQTLYPENPGDPCRWVIYKHPDGFPSEAYTSVGKSR